MGLFLYLAILGAFFFWFGGGWGDFFFKEIKNEEPKYIIDEERVLMDFGLLVLKLSGLVLKLSGKRAI